MRRKWNKWRTPFYIRPCTGRCGLHVPHTHDLTALGKWDFVGKYAALDLIYKDPRPQPPVNEHDGSPWFKDYEKDWAAKFPGYPFRSCWARDEKGYWVWVTDTPPFDRDWFDKQGWQFPAAWITASSLPFYRVGADQLSEIVSLPPKEGGSSVPKDEKW